MKRNMVIILAIVLLFVGGCTYSATSNKNVNATSTDDLQQGITSPSSTTYEVIPSKSTQEVNYEVYIDQELFPLPKGMKYIGGYLIVQNPNFRIDLILHNGVYTIWFSEGKVVKDIQVLPELEEDEVIPGEYCQVEGKIDPFVFAIAKLNQETFEKRIIENSQIQHAWRADPVLGKVNETSLLGLECSGEGGFDPNNIIYKFSQ